MGEYNFSDMNGGEASKDDKKKPGITISPVAALILLLLAVCLSVLVGLIVHFASPGKLTFTCTQPGAGTQAPSNPSELTGRCLELITGGDATVCVACPKATSKPTPKPSTVPTDFTTTSLMSTDVETTPSATTTPAPIINYRLPSSVKPWHYHLEIQPEIYGNNASLFTFNGSVSIILNVTQATSNITLHKQDLTIDDDIELKVIDDPSMMAPKIINVTYEEVTQFFVIHLGGDLDPSYSYDISMNFEGKMRTDLSGLYLSSYKDGNDTVYIATTQFVPPDARKAFPCFDEPSQKATFDVTVLRKQGTGRNYKTFANTDIIRNETRGEYVADIHATTPRMSTYIVAFIVCDFDYYENRTSNIDYRTVARPNAIQYFSRAHKYGMEIFDWFASTFVPAFPVSKLDNIMIPDFKYAAMENWGLIVYNQDRFMYKPEESTASTDQFIEMVIAHEIAHQWFGNVVSHKWWWWVWLKEAFAEFWAHRSLDSMHPQKRKMEQFTVGSMLNAFFIDGFRTSHPLTNDAESYAQISGYYDTITYTKGGAIARMMEFIMGKSNFIQGLNLYLTRNQYSVAEHQDLWDSLTESTQNGTFINMTDIMDPWVTQMNYPLVTVRVVGPGQIHFRQERFLNNKAWNTTGDTAKYDYRWTIPITVASSSDTSNFQKEYTFFDIAWLDKSQVEATFNDSTIPDPQDPDSWVVVNLQQTGFYRVNYEDKNWMALIRQLERDHEVFPALTRAQIINDAWGLFDAGVVNVTIALRTFNYLKNETDYIPWSVFERRGRELVPLFEKTDLYGAFKEFMKDSVQKTYDTWGLDVREDAENINVYQLALGARYACNYGVQNCIDDALQMYRNWMTDNKNNRLNPNIQDTVICNGIRYGGVKEWNFAFNECWKSETGALKRDCFNGLACTREPWLLEKMLNLVFDNSTFSRSEASTVIRNVNSNSRGTELAWNFLKTNFMKLETYLGRPTLSGLLSSVSNSFKTEYFLSELQDLAARDVAAQYVSDFNRAILRTKQNMKLLDETREVLTDWLIERGYGDYVF